MDSMTQFGIIAGICILVIFIALLKRRSQVILNFLVRMVLGAICIIFTNDFLAGQEISIAVGLNPVSLLTVGILGFSGFALLYGIVFCKFL